MAPAPALSEDIIGAEILTRLPVKSILRFRSVCKRWKSLFSTSDFKISHLNLTSQNPNKNSLVVNKVVEDDRRKSFEISILDKCDFSETRISDALYSKRSSVDMIGSVNGLVCLLLKPKQIILWNPAIRRYKNLYFPWLLQLPIDICGLCWDPVQNDYKVVMCSNEYLRSPAPTKEGFSYVYSWNSDFWKLLPNFSFVPNRISGTPAAIVKGCPVWFCKEIPDRYSILKFEAGSDEFRLLPQFEYAKHMQNGFLLVTLKDCLTALVYNAWTSNCVVDVYRLDEGYGVWKKMYTVGPLPSYVNALSHCFNYGGEIMFCIFGDFLCYDHKTNKIKGFGNQKGRLINSYSYMATFVCIDGMEH